jgi:hypothetical protein
MQEQWECEHRGGVRDVPAGRSRHTLDGVTRVQAHQHSRPQPRTCSRAKAYSCFMRQTSLPWPARDGVRAGTAAATGAWASLGGVGHDAGGTIAPWSPGAGGHICPDEGAVPASGAVLSPAQDPAPGPVPGSPEGAVRAGACDDIGVDGGGATGWNCGRRGDTPKAASAEAKKAASWRRADRVATPRCTKGRAWVHADSKRVQHSQQMPRPQPQASGHI